MIGQISTVPGAATLAALLISLLFTGCLAPPPNADGAQERYAVHGIDVSHWQGRIDWPRTIDSRIRFAFMKATEGYDFRDPQFERNRRALENSGVLRGACHFLALIKDGERQACNFIGAVRLMDSDLPPMLDVKTYYSVNDRSARRPPSDHLHERNHSPPALARAIP